MYTESLERFFHNEFKHGYWYLLVLAVYYILLLPLRFIRFAQYNFIKDTIIGCIIFVLLKFLDKRVGDDLFSLSLIANFWIYFYIGFLVKRYNGINWLINKKSLFSIAFISYIPLLILYDKGIIVHFAQIVPLTAIIILLYIFVCRNDKYSKIENLLEWIGNRLLIFIYIITLYY